MTLENIIVKDTVKRSEIDVITYSRAVQKKAFSDAIENTFVSDVYKMLSHFQPFVAAFLKSSDVNDEHFVKMLLSFCGSTGSRKKQRRSCTSID
jgi:hypothetical protein